MAISSSGSAAIIWRVRKSGNNLNGGGYDPSISGVLSTTVSTAFTTGSTTLVVTSAVGWPSSGNYYAHIGNNVSDVGASRGDGLSSPTASEVVLVTAGQGTTTWTVSRAQLGTSDPGKSWAIGVAVDNELTRCDTAVASGAHATSTNSTTITDLTFDGFNSTHVGLTLYLSSGTGTPVAGFYTILSITDAGDVVVDRVSGTYTAGVWKLGGGWADPRTNTTSAQAAINPGNTLYIQGPGTDPAGPRTADYTPGAAVTLPSGGNTTGTIKFIGEYGRPALQGSVNSFATLGTNNIVQKLYFMGKTTCATAVVNPPNNGTDEFVDCVFDQNGFDQSLVSNVANDCQFYGCEFFNSGSAPAAANAAILLRGTGLSSFIEGNNFHNLTAGVFSTSNAGQVVSFMGNIVASCGADCITLGAASPTSAMNFSGNTFDANAGNCITISQSDYLALVTIKNNIFSNNVGAGKTAINVTAGTTAANDLIKRFIDWNSYHNNTANVAGISLGKHDTLVGSDPYVGQSTENYTLA